ncbi:MAG: sulfite exporter TauE/SafE family protein [Candidatus Omnitrophota bacterium]
MPTNFFEIFYIGFAMGLSGPCLFYCMPIIFAFTIGNGKEFKRSILDILVFLCARFLAYIVLAFLAAISGILLRKIVGPATVYYFKPLAGAVSIGLGLYIFFRKDSKESGCRMPAMDISGLAGLFILGFLIGISPCPPLIFLLSDIALLAKSVGEGVLYGIAFGLGTFIPAFIITAGLAGLFKKATQNFFRSAHTVLFLRIASSAILIFFGVSFIAGLFKA